MKSTKSAVSRRAFLKTMGSAMAYAPVVNLLRSRITEAAPAVAPLRLICVWEPFQVTQPYFYPQSIVNGAASGIGADAGAPFTLNFANSALAPYAPYQSQMIVFRGLNRVDAQLHATAGHMSSATTFTGAKCSYGSGGSSLTTSGTSIDNYIFNRMKLASPSLLGPLNAAWPQMDNGISFDGTPNSAGLNSISNPQTLFNTYFGNYKAPGSTSTSNLPARQSAIYANTLNHLQQLRTRLASSEGAVLDAHISAVQSFQSLAKSGTGGSSASCTPPLASTMTNDQGNGSGGPDYSHFNADITNWTTLITQSFACDLTRIAMLNIGSPWEGQSPDLYPLITTQISNNLVSQFNSSNGGYHGQVTHQTNAVATTTALNADLQMPCYGLFFQKKIAALMASLQSTPDPYNPSQTLLDNTVILLASEHANQEAFNNGGTIQGTDAHSYVDGKFILLGGCGGLFKGNQIIAGTPRVAPFSAGLAVDQGYQGFNLVSATPNSSTCYSYYMGMPHNGLLTTLVNAFENNLGKFNASYTPNYLSWYGEPTYKTWNNTTWSAMNLGQTGF
jgi:hypothetical protein